MTVPTITLNQGNAIPQLGFGVFKVPPDVTQGIVEEALAAGYRHLDTAKHYQNEAEVGRAIRASGIPREQLFVTTKLWNEDHRAGDIRGGYERSLATLDIGYVDLYLIHWPLPALEKYVGAWEQLAEFKAEGLTRAIGVSNFQIAHLERIIAATGVVPAVDQVELHPLFQQRPLRAFLAGHGIAVEAWGPLGQAKFDLAQPPIAAAAAAHHKSLAQVILRWHLQSGTIVIPKASTRVHMDENLNVFDFDLTSAEMAAIDALDTNRRLSGDPDTTN
ncbi:MAG: aldo/keto reductase [Propionibacteriaceae bacterium]|jgi:2,5-diketo-D-gluconate reductase A|nr:aldo/keto reductase [Propionibacteriaceae bacterium]